MRRALADLLDPPPTERDQQRLRAHFEHRCCYCGASAPPGLGHFDHARPQGGNGLANFVLACAACNGNEKREADWEDFLATKCPASGLEYAQRRAHILAWVGQCEVADDEARSPEVQAALAAAESSIIAFEAAYNELRRALVAARSRTDSPAVTAD